MSDNSFDNTSSQQEQHDNDNTTQGDGGSSFMGPTRIGRGSGLPDPKDVDEDIEDMNTGIRADHRFLGDLPSARIETEEEEEMNANITGAVFRSMKIESPSSSSMLMHSSPFKSPGYCYGLNAEEMLSFPDVTLSQKMPSSGVQRHQQQQSQSLGQIQEIITVPPTRTMPSLPSMNYDFGWDLDQVKIPSLPKFFPKSHLTKEIPMQDLTGVLQRIPRCAHHLSLQAEYRDDPVSADFRTIDHVDLNLRFWKGDNGSTFYIDIQRRKGDHLVANRCIQRLLDAATGQVVDSQAPTTSDMNRHQVEQLESLVERIIRMAQSAKESESIHSSQPTSTTTDDYGLKHTLNMLHMALTNNRCNERKQALEHLAAFTDLQKTCSSAAIPTALMVLQGTSPFPEFTEKCQEIQKVLIQIFLNKTVQGDEQLVQDLMEVDFDDFDFTFLANDDHDLFPDPLPPQYAEYMNELVHLTLAIFVNSLEVVACFADQLGNVETIVSNFSQTCQTLSGGMDIYVSLLECVQRSNYQPANGYLACKALRLLSSFSPNLRGRLQHDTQAAALVGGAVQLGRARHTLLQAESERLWKMLYVI